MHWISKDKDRHEGERILERAEEQMRKDVYNAERSACLSCLSDTEILLGCRWGDGPGEMGGDDY